MSDDVTQQLLASGLLSLEPVASPATTPWSEPSSNPAEDIRAFIRWYSSEAEQDAERTQLARWQEQWVQLVSGSDYTVSYGVIHTHRSGKRQAMVTALEISSAMDSLAPQMPSPTGPSPSSTPRRPRLSEQELSRPRPEPAPLDLWWLDESSQVLSSVVESRQRRRRSLELSLESPVFRPPTVSPAAAATR